MTLNALSQRDPRWSSYPLGSTTIGSDGCLITDLAILLGMSPIDVITKLLAVGGLLNGQLVIWDKLPVAFPRLTQHRVWAYDEALANSQYPTLLEVDFDGTPKTDNKHWVILINKDQIIDPWTGTVESSGKYPLKTGFCLITLPQSQPGQQANYYKGLDLTNIDSMKVAIDTWERVKNGELVDKAMFETQAQAAASCQSQLSTALDQNKSFQSQIASLQTELKDVKSKYETEAQTVLDLKKELEETHKQDRDYGQEALDAQHIAGTHKEALNTIAAHMDINYDPTNDKQLVDEVLKKMAILQQQNTPEENSLQTIMQFFVTMGINNFLSGRGIAPLNPATPDPDREEKIRLYLTALAEELLGKQPTATTEQTSLISTDNLSKPSLIMSLVERFIGIFAVRG